MSRSRYTLAFDHNNMVPAPAGSATVQTMFKSEDGVLMCWGTGTPPTTASTYAEGCLYFKVNDASGNTLYKNYGTYASPDFEEVLDVNNVLTHIQAEYLATAAAGVGPSPDIWDDAKILEVMLDPTKGYYYFEDFLKFNPVTAEGITITQTGSEGTVANDPTVEGGVIDISTGGSTAADGPTVQFAGMQIKPQAGTTIYFECRVKVSVDDSRWYIGLADDAATDYVSDDTVDITKNQAGFYRDGDLFGQRNINGHVNSWSSF